MLAYENLLLKIFGHKWLLLRFYYYGTAHPKLANKCNYRNSQDRSISRAIFSEFLWFLISGYVSEINILLLVGHR